MALSSSASHSANWHGPQHTGPVVGEWQHAPGVVAPQGTGNGPHAPAVPEGTGSSSCKPAMVATEQPGRGLCVLAAVTPEETGRGPRGRGLHAPAGVPEGAAALPAADRNPSPTHSGPGQIQRPLLAHSRLAAVLLLWRSPPGMPATPCRAPHCSDGDPAHSSLGD